MINMLLLTIKVWISGNKLMNKGKEDYKGVWSDLRIVAAGLRLNVQ